MDFYDGAQLVLTIDGQTPECLTDISLSEVLELAPSQNAADGWQRFRPNNQSFSISFSGDNTGGFEYLRGIKRAFTRVDWVLKTDDDSRTMSGFGYIETLDRNSDSDENETFSANMVGYGAIV